MNRDALRALLADPRAYADQPASIAAERWRQALVEVAVPGAEGSPLNALRPEQVAAWSGLEAQRLGLILGPPGTGKTFLLALMIASNIVLSRRLGVPCRVLVTAFTKTAIANVLERVLEILADMKEEGLPVTLVGPYDAERETIPVTPRQGFASATAAEQCVVGATTWQCFGALERGEHGDVSGFVADLFGLVCIDEASQFPVGQGLLAFATAEPGARILVAGDNRQLAPIASSATWEVDDRGLCSSLYDFLLQSDVPEFALTETFRLNGPLAAFPQERFYDAYGPAPGIGGRRLPLREGWEAGLEGWLRTALHPDHPITILLYDGPGSWATRNPVEAELLTRCTEALRERLPGSPVSDSEFWTNRAAVVTPHRAQNATLRTHLTEVGLGEACVVETVERIQGRERDTLIVGYCVSDPEFALVEGSFLFSPERFNVSITRARFKLILVLSRRLLEVVPDDQDIFDSAQLLREFVFRSDYVDEAKVLLASGRRLSVSVFTRRFDDVEALKGLDFPEPVAGVEPLLPLTDEQEALLAAIQQEQQARPEYDSVFETSVARRASLRTPLIPFDQLHVLLQHGHIELQWWDRGRPACWRIRPIEPARRPYSVDLSVVRERIRQVIDERRVRGTSWYRDVCGGFLWLDERGEDVLRPQVATLEAEGWIKIEGDGRSLRIDYPDEEVETTPVPPPISDLSDEDFVILNALEDLEVKCLNFGVFESWRSVPELAAAVGLPTSLVEGALGRLEEHGHLILDDTFGDWGRVRSRMAELAREVRYVRQRFRHDDRDDRPFLVRAMKVAAVARGKPARDRPLAELFTELHEDLKAVKSAPAVLDALAAVLGARWGQDAAIAGFQYRAIVSLLRAWCGHESPRSAVVTAATGAGKTEAACLPMIAGAAIDELQGIRGTRAVLVYPRIRLAWNQAQRLVGYAAALSAQPGMPLITMGVQNKDVLSAWRWAGQDSQLERRPSGRWSFPFFRCPVDQCDAELEIQPGDQHVDSLICISCGWSHSGWIGTKDGLRGSPPHIFLSVTESLHQWMQDPQAARLWGDVITRPPRAMLADEIHLYSLIAGAQVGFALRRLLARAAANEPMAPPMLAIGMSATLGDPVRTWATLIGRERADVSKFGATDDERRPNPRAREYYYFVQPEIESRGAPIKAASTTIQTLMCLAHGMRRRTGRTGGFRSLVFLDSIDKLKRLHAQYGDAERRRLASLRTASYPDGPAGDRRETCCGNPVSCDVFHAGECWYFAATDERQWTAAGRYARTRPLAVSRRPIWSATSGADDVIRTSDIVFATSSLEVGYDDPDMTLVYQQFAPRNLASFVQRKGRGGRGADDRPLTGVTLSLYSPRDSYYFRKPRTMLQADDFEVPLNVDNYFVLRGQALSVLLDCAARYAARTGWSPVPSLHPEVFSMASGLASVVFGPEVVKTLEVSSLEELWTDALHAASSRSDPLRAVAAPRKWLAQLDEAPTALFDTVNLPQAEVVYPDQDNFSETERIDQSWTGDIILALAQLCPGNMTRRWGRHTVHWTPWGGPRAPMGDPAGGATIGLLQKLSHLTAPGALLAALPREGRDAIGTDPLHERIARITRTRVEEAGYHHFGRWRAAWVWDGDRGEVARARGPRDPRGLLDDDCVGRLAGCAIVSADVAAAEHLPAALFGAGFPGAVNLFRGRRGTRKTGLQVAQVYWGADIRLNYRAQPEGGRRDRGRVHLRQLFVDRQDRQPRLYGFTVDTEGIQLRVDSDSLDSFISDEQSHLDAHHPEARWLRGQLLRYLIAAGSHRIGINSFQATYLSRLLVAAVAVEDWRRQLRTLTRLWDSTAFFQILRSAWERFLAWDPELTEGRVDELEDVVGMADFREMYVDTMAAVRSNAEFQGFLRSLVLHGLGVRLKHAFVLHGRGDERRVLVHAQLPIQFGETCHDVITVCERGAQGDGTTRTFLSRAHEAAAEWARDGIVSCPNAEADAALSGLLAVPSRHADWLARDPLSLKTLQDIGVEVGVSTADGLQAIARALFGEERVSGESFRLFDLHLELEAVATQLGSQMRREATTWELVGAVVAAALEGDPRTPRWSALLTAFGRIPQAVTDESLAAGSRLAEQAYRLSGRLCRDGCLACLHTGSDLFDREQAQVTVSRRVLERFWDFSVARAVVSPPPAPDIEVGVIGEEWAALLIRIRSAQPGIEIEPGRDVTGSNGRVVGTTFAVVGTDGRQVELVDDRGPYPSDLLKALSAAAKLGLRVRPTEDADVVLRHLGGNS